MVNTNSINDSNSFEKMARLIMRQNKDISRQSYENISVRLLTFGELVEDSRFIKQIENIQLELWQNYDVKGLRTLIDTVRLKGNKRWGTKTAGFIIGAIENDGLPDSELKGFFIAELEIDKIMGGRLLGVSKNAHGRKIGTKLMHTLMNCSQKEGYELISLPFDPSNAAAAYLYLGNGGIITQYYPDLYGKKGNRVVIEMPLNNKRTRNLVEKNSGKLKIELDRDYNNMQIFSDYNDISSFDFGKEFLIQKPSRPDDFETYFLEAVQRGFGATRILKKDNDFYYYFENCINLLDKATELYANGDKETAFAYIDLAVYLDPENNEVMRYFEKLLSEVRKHKTDEYLQKEEEIAIRGPVYRGIPTKGGIEPQSYGVRLKSAGFEAKPVFDFSLDIIKTSRLNNHNRRKSTLEAYLRNNNVYM